MTKKRWTRFAVLAPAAAVLIAAGAIAQVTAADASPGRNGVTICVAGHGDREVTTRVTRRAADRLLRSTRAYPGACAAYGPESALGDGSLRTYTQYEDGLPVAIGVVFGRRTLHNLPTAMTDAHHCFDVNGDGVIDTAGMVECMGGHERPLQLPAERYRAGLPEQWTLVNYNPHGHGPPGVYDVPHFDFHFYIQPKAERDAIRPGPCGFVVNCDDFARGKMPVPAAYAPPDYSDLGAVEVAMGNHLVDLTSPEFSSPFTHTFIYGAYDAKISFLEPMITLAWFQDLASGDQANACFPIKQPQGWQASGYYPRDYCIRYRANRDDFTVSLEHFYHS